MMRAALPRPFRQGELDSLCGIYAVVNAIKLGLYSTGQSLRNEDWQELFATLIACADDHLGAATAVITGIETRYLKKILKSATLHLRDEHDIHIVWDALLQRREKPSFSSLLKDLRAIVSRPGETIIFTVEGYISHWAVLRAVTDSYLLLYDSSGYHRLTIANCRMLYEPWQDRREHVIPPDAAFTVRIANGCYKQCHPC